MSFSYAAYLEKAKISLMSASHEVNTLADHAENGGIPGIRGAALSICDECAILSGILGYETLSGFLKAFRTFSSSLGANRALSGTEIKLLRLAGSFLAEAGQALDPLPEYAELVSVNGVALRPPLKTRPDPQPFIDLAQAAGNHAATIRDGSILRFDSGKSDEYALGIPREKVAKARDENRCISLIVLDIADQPFSGLAGFQAMIDSLAGSGALLKYGALHMPETRLSDNGFILPVYLVLKTGSGIGEFCASSLLRAKFTKELFPNTPRKLKTKAPGPIPADFKQGDFREFEEKGIDVAEVTSAKPESPGEPISSETQDPAFENDFDLTIPTDINFPDLAAISLSEDHLNVEALDFDPVAGNIPAPAELPPAQKTDTVQKHVETAATKGAVKTIRNVRESIRFPIAVKLISIISILFITSLSGMIFIASWFFQSDTTVRIEENNKTLSDVIGLKVEEDFSSIVEKSALLVKEARAKSPVASQAGTSAIASPDLFGKDREIIFIGIYSDDISLPALEFPNQGFAEDRKLKTADIKAAAASFTGERKRASSGETICVNASTNFREPVLLVAAPYRTNDIPGAIIVLFASTERFQKSFRMNGITTAWIQDPRGVVLAHQDPALVASAVSFGKSPMTDFISGSKLNNGQTRYKSDDPLSAAGSYWLGSFKRLGFGGISVVTAVPESKAFEAVAGIQRRNIYLAIAIVGLAILVVWFYAKTLTRPINRLVDAAQKIEAGVFLLDLAAKSRDEIGVLTRSFVHMGKGLDEREKIKATFGKFVNKEIAEQAIRGELKLGGERKRATIFFSDIRGFTSISEKLEPEEVVEFLNKYMTAMVNCVNATHGVVDKYIGDAIMAVWGAPVSHGNDTENAVNAALMMRTALIDFNKDRGSERKPVIRIGCGLNSGPLIAGQIGSNDRMEYTVIGDAVNLASRIEALNKPFGSDILISSDTRELVRDIFKVEPMKPIAVKGKAEPQQIFAVLGRFDDPACPESLADVQKLLNIERKNLDSVNVDDEEVKFKIIEEKK